MSMVLTDSQLLQIMAAIIYAGKSANFTPISVAADHRGIIECITAARNIQKTVKGD